jgi:hypothetical protein
MSNLATTPAAAAGQFAGRATQQIISAVTAAKNALANGLPANTQLGLPACAASDIQNAFGTANAAVIAALANDLGV